MGFHRLCPRLDGYAVAKIQAAVGGYNFIRVSSTNLPITSVQFTWDGDGDGITFVSNIAFGTSVPNPVIIPDGPGSLKTVWPATGNFTLLQGANLAGGTWVTNSSPITTGNRTNRIAVSPPVGTLFFRLTYP
jgi:hypothetical protein